MKLGLALPTAGEHASPEAIGSVAEGAERIGLDRVWAFERQIAPTGPVGMGGQSFELPENYRTVYSPLEVLAFAAARTSTIGLGTSIIIALLHQPAALARSFATLDQLCGGRLIAGLGQGWMKEEFEAAGVPMERQGAGFGEFVDALRAAWGPDPVKYEGSHYTIPESYLNPKPVQPGGPPMIVGAFAPASLRRAARQGIGFNPVIQPGMDLSALEGVVQGFHAAEREAGREAGGLPVVLRINASLYDEPVEERGLLSGSPEQVAEDLPQVAALGVDEAFWSMDYDPVLPGDQLARMERLVAAAGKTLG
ncbi:TIGR03619 family F420-dependent LLM class oxidoreductase [Streptomyces sp. A7024]|uniref:TIGR03619 family F420-dependent LLM class oxidoreductase n=1 Tax=Streptomyces coryli TaxID=1128680 RepID=A0A6G4TYR0_9ACTN|nr:TIGR03619 family F420-dependent LLM class oxidoreductase [Streptomyces coryli]NGN64258.1 TIGR03619 family F420-dependent LLM class oxidoreductase [Streptomyces coryli]